MDHERYPYYFDDNAPAEARTGRTIAGTIAAAIEALRRAMSRNPAPAAAQR